MTARYQRWLIPKGASFTPSAAGLAKLVARLRKDKFLPEAPGKAVRTVEVDDDTPHEEKMPATLEAGWLEDPSREELRMVWHVQGDEGLRHPLTSAPGAASYAIEVHRSADYVVPEGENVGKLPTTCACGDDLSFGWDEDEVKPAFPASTGIFAECDACSRTFDPAKGSATMTDPLDGSKQDVRGGAAYRFAIKVDLGADFARGIDVKFDPALVAALEEEFGREFWQLAVATKK